MPRKVKPCRICGLIQPVMIEGQDRSSDIGYFCEWFKVRVHPDEVGYEGSPVRQACISSGDAFAWSRPGQGPVELRDAIAADHAKRRLRRYERLAAAVGLVGVVIGAAELFLR